MAFLTDLGNNLRNLFNTGVSDVGNFVHNFQQPITAQHIGNTQPLNYPQVFNNISTQPVVKNTINTLGNLRESDILASAIPGGNNINRFVLKPLHLQTPTISQALSNVNQQYSMPQGYFDASFKKSKGVALTPQEQQVYDAGQKKFMENNMNLVLGTLGGESNVVRKGATTTEQYLTDLYNAQKGARTGPVATIKQQGAKAIGALKTALVNAQAPIEDVLSKAEKQNKFTVLPTKDVRLQIDRVLRSDTLAGQFAKDNGLVDVIKKAPDLRALNQYLIAKQAQAVAKNGIVTGRNAALDKQLIKQLGATYEPFAQQVTAYSHKILDYITGSGLIDSKTAALLKKKYPAYVPLNRIFSEAEQAAQTFKGTGKGVASLSKQTVVQKLKGSERQIEDPITSLLTKTQTAFDQAERNIAAQQLASYKDLPGNPFEITPLRTAENVTKRIDLYSQAKDLKPIQNKLSRLLVTRNRWSRQLNSAISQLNAKGLYLSLKEKAPGAIVLTKKFQTTGELAARDTKRLVNNLINLPSSEVEKIKSMIATRENRLGPVLDQIATMSDSLQAVKGVRANLLDTAHGLKDLSSTGKNTFSVLKNGIKEIYQTTPEVAAAAKSLDKEQANLIIRILNNVFTRPLRLGATGLNYPFAVANLLKDQSSAFLNSKNALATQTPLAFIKGLFAAVGHGNLYDEVVRNAAGGTSFDIGRQAPQLAVSKIRNTRNILGRIVNVARSPIRTVEDLIGRTEELTRAQQYHGYYDSLIKQGRTVADAKLLAAQQARENTVNFARGGTFTKMANYLVPYLNAGVQGSRTFIRNLQNRPVQTATKFMIGVGMPVAAATVWNLSDPQRRAAYNDIPDFEKQNSLIIVPPNPVKNADGTWNVIKLPLSQEAAPLTALVRRPIEQAAGLDPTSIGEMANALFQTGTSLNSSSGTSLLSSFVPQGSKPFIEAGLNKNLYTGQPIVPDALKNLPPEQQVKKDTSGTARIIGKALNVSPLLVQNEAQTLFGGTGPQVLNAADTGLNKLGIIPNNQVSTKSVGNALQKRFLQAAGGNTYFSARDQLMKGLSPKETEAYAFLHTAKAVDANGNPIEDTPILNSPQKATIYLNYPNLLQIDTTLAKQNPQHDPFYDLPTQWQKVVLASRVQLPGQKNPYDSYLAQQPWYSGYLQQQSAYYNSLPQTTGTTNTQTLQRPQPSTFVQQQMDAKNWKNPEVQAYLNALTTYNNNQLASLGLPSLGSGYSPYQRKVSFKFKSPKIPSLKSLKVAKIKPVKIGKTKTLATAVKTTKSTKIPTFKVKNMKISFSRKPKLPNFA